MGIRLATYIPQKIETILRKRTETNVTNVTNEQFINSLFFRLIRDYTFYLEGLEEICDTGECYEIEDWIINLISTLILINSIDFSAWVLRKLDFEFIEGNFTVTTSEDVMKTLLSYRFLCINLDPQSKEQAVELKKLLNNVLNNIFYDLDGYLDFTREELIKELKSYTT